MYVPLQEIRITCALDLKQEMATELLENVFFFVILCQRGKIKTSEMGDVLQDIANRMVAV